MDRKTFLERYGEEPDAWHPHLDEMLDKIEHLGYSTEKSNNNGLANSSMSPFSVYMIEKDLHKNGLELSDIYNKPNSHGLRSDEFTTEHHGLHVLFAGCSVTFGEALPEEYIWPKIVYDRLREKEQNISGYFNVGINGGNHLDIINQVFSYIKKFGNPNVIFINFPDTQRLIGAGLPEEYLHLVTFMYEVLELYCENMLIKLVSFSHYPFYNLNAPKDQERPVKNDPLSEIVLKDTFYQFEMNDLAKAMYDAEKDSLPDFLQSCRILAFDRSHPGISVHKFYAMHALSSYDKMLAYIPELDRQLLPQDRSKLPFSIAKKIEQFDFAYLNEFRMDLDGNNKRMREEMGVPENSALSHLLTDTSDSRSFFIERGELAKIGASLGDLYSLNSRGYRSDEFKKHHDGLHVLFAGCSVTFGQGLFLEDTWSKIVYEELAKTNNMSGYYNIAIPGSSKTRVVSEIQNYIDEFSTPDLILINFPDSYRDLDISSSPKFGGIDLIAEFLETISDRVLTMTWSSEHELDPIPSRGEFTPEEIKEIRGMITKPINFIDYSYKDMNKYIDKIKIDTDPKYLKYRAFDGAHPGTGANRFYAGLFLRKIDKDGKIIK